MAQRDFSYSLNNFTPIKKLHEEQTKVKCDALTLRQKLFFETCKIDPVDITLFVLGLVVIW